MLQPLSFAAASRTVGSCESPRLSTDPESSGAWGGAVSAAGGLSAGSSTTIVDSPHASVGADRSRIAVAAFSDSFHPSGSFRA